MSQEERLLYINDVQDFVKYSSSRIDNIFSSLGWSASEFEHPNAQNSQCPVDKGHWMPKEKLSKHLEICSLKKEGYCESDVLLPPSTGDETLSVKIDLETRRKILSAAFSANPGLKLGVENILEDQRPIPRTADRCISDFTVDEQRILYDFAVSQTSIPCAERNVEDVHLFENIGRTSTEPAKTTKTLKEIMIEMRDAKRRRASYKGKKVKAKSRSHTETLKNLIETQMDILKEMRGEDPIAEESISSTQKAPTEAEAFDESGVLERPKQLFEKVDIPSDRWSHIGDWVCKHSKKERDDYWSISEGYKFRHSSCHGERQYDRRRHSDKGHGDEEKDRFRRHKRSRSPDMKCEFKSDLHSRPSSFSRDNRTSRDERKDSGKAKDSSHLKYFAKSSSPYHQVQVEKKNSRDDGRNKRQYESQSRSRSHSRSHSKHKKHKRERKEKKHKKHSKEHEDYKRARYESASDESESPNDKPVKSNSPGKRHHNSHKKKRKEKKKK